MVSIFPRLTLLNLSSLLIFFILLQQVFLVLNLVCPQLGSMSVQRTVIVGFTQQRLDGEEYRSNLVQSRPFLLQDVQADVAVGVDVGVKAGSSELYGRGLVRVACIRKYYSMSLHRKGVSC